VVGAVSFSHAHMQCDDVVCTHAHRDLLRLSAARRLIASADVGKVQAKVRAALAASGGLGSPVAGTPTALSATARTRDFVGSDGEKDATSPPPPTASPKRREGTLVGHWRIVKTNVSALCLSPSISIGGDVRRVLL